MLGGSGRSGKFAQYRAMSSSVVIYPVLGLITLTCDNIGIV
jgi:hypothetical protein